MTRETPITVEWLEAHGFEKLEGMMPAGYGRRYAYSFKLAQGESIYIEVSATPDTYGIYPLHMSVRSKQQECEIYKNEAELSKKQCDYEKGIRNCFYVEELLTLLDLTDNGDLKEFFI